MNFGFTRVRDRVRFLHCLIGLFQQSTCVIEKDTSGVRQADRLRGALKQSEPGLIFEIANLPAKRRLRNVKLERGARDVFHLGHCHEIAQCLSSTASFSMPARHAEARNMVFHKHPSTNHHFFSKRKKIMIK